MNLEKNLIKLLDKFIQKNRIEKSKYEIIIKKKEIYDGLIKLLDDNYDIMIQKQDIILTLLNQIYSNNDFYEDFKKMISEFDNIKSYRTNLIVEYNELLEDIEYYQLHFDENNSLIESAHRIKNSLKYNKLITTPEEDIKNIEKILNIMSVEYEVSDKDVLLYMNILKFHNDRKLAKTDLPEEQEYIEFKYSEIPNILNAGFQENDVIEVSINKKIILDMLAIEIIERISEFNEEEITELLSAFKKQYIYDNEYNYILLKMLDLYLDELIELYKLLLDKDIYTDEQSKEEVIEEYYNKLNKYLVINQYYNHSIEYTAIDEEISNDIEYKTEKKLIYSRSETNITKSRIISDMHDIPYEYYDTVYDLLTRFKSGKLASNELKRLHNHKNFCGHIELRYDQVRIILKHIKENLYNVLGVFAKKSDNDIHMYGRIISRGIPDVDTDEKINMQLELAQITEEELDMLVTDKGRKGTR